MGGCRWSALYDLLPSARARRRIPPGIAFGFLDCLDICDVHNDYLPDEHNVPMKQCEWVWKENATSSDGALWLGLFSGALGEAFARTLHHAWVWGHRLMVDDVVSLIVMPLKLWTLEPQSVATRPQKGQVSEGLPGCASRH